MDNESRLYKIAFLHAGIVTVGFIVFLAAVANTILSDRKIPNLTALKKDKAVKGEIYSKDGLKLVNSTKIYQAAINTNSLNSDKKELFVKLFSIYSGIDENKILKKIDSKKGYIILSNAINSKRAKDLKMLNYKLNRLQVFNPYESKKLKKTIFPGLDITEIGEQRIYNYQKIFEPYLGYTTKRTLKNKSYIYGTKGIENFYEGSLRASQDGFIKGKRDRASNVIINNDAVIHHRYDGLKLLLNIDLLLQNKIEKVIDKFKKEFDANEIVCAVMESKTGKLFALASTKRFDPNHIRPADIPNLNATISEKPFEVGSIMKPIVFSILLDNKLITLLDVINGYNGRMKIGKRYITDEHKYKWIGAEDVIVHSSNIGMFQLAQKLTAQQIYDGFKKFGLREKTGIDLPYEQIGRIPTIKQLSTKIYKGSISYGYSISATFIQMLKAYSAFNNEGKMATPSIVNQAITYKDRFIKKTIYKQAISPQTAVLLKRVLKKVVKRGTGIGAQIQGLEIGGKTGTAHISENGKYTNKYNSSFFGFANDSYGHNYTIGVTVIKPKNEYFAAKTAVPVFKKIVQKLLISEYLMLQK